MLKTILSAVLGLGAVVLGALGMQERAQSQRLVSRLDDLEARLRLQPSDLQKRTVAADAGAAGETSLAAEEDVPRKRHAKVRAAPKADALAAAAPPRPPEIFEAEIKDSLERKKQLRTRAGVVRRQQYGDLVRNWGLSPDQANTFYEVLADRDEAQPDATIKDPAAIAAAKAKADEALKAALGNENYQEYQEYKKTLDERSAINQFKQRLDGDNVDALTPAQAQGLLKILTEERDDSQSYGAAEGPADVERLIKAQTSYNEKLAARAASLLTPDQLASFKQVQESKLESRRKWLEVMSGQASLGP